MIVLHEAGVASDNLFEFALIETLKEKATAVAEYARLQQHNIGDRERSGVHDVMAVGRRIGAIRIFFRSADAADSGRSRFSQAVAPVVRVAPH